MAHSCRVTWLDRDALPVPLAVAIVDGFLIPELCRREIAQQNASVSAGRNLASTLMTMMEWREFGKRFRILLTAE